MDVHLDHSGIGGDQQRLDPRVRRRPIALQNHGNAGLRRSPIDESDQLDELFQPLQWR